MFKNPSSERLAPVLFHVSRLVSLWRFRDLVLRSAVLQSRDHFA
jgi:hypothetical protein